MKKIIIEAQSVKGAEAIKKHLEEFNKLNWAVKTVIRVRGTKQKIICNNPLTLMVTSKSKHSNNPANIDLFLQNIHQAMKSNGAEDVRDYLIKIEEAN